MAAHVRDLPPLLERVFEAAARAIGVGQGAETLELRFQDGKLERWYRHDQANGAHELRRFDADAARELSELLLERARTVRAS